MSFSCCVYFERLFICRSSVIFLCKVFGFFNSISKITCAMVICFPLASVPQEFPVCWFNAYEKGLSGLLGDQFFLNQWRYRYSPRWTCPRTWVPQPRCAGSMQGVGDALWGLFFWPLPSTASFGLSPLWLHKTWPPETAIVCAARIQVLLFQSNIRILPL